MSVDWSYFNKYQGIDDMYLPRSGEGDNMATQIVTAVTKLVYKWYNDGDVFDNTYTLPGWANDLSSYANWLYKNCPPAKRVLVGISACDTEGDYEDLLKDLADRCFDEDLLAGYAEKPVVDSIYTADGPFKFEERYDDEDYDEDDYPYEDEYDEEEY